MLWVFEETRCRLTRAVGSGELQHSVDPRRMAPGFPIRIPGRICSNNSLGLSGKYLILVYPDTRVLKILFRPPCGCPIGMLISHCTIWAGTTSATAIFRGSNLTIP